MQSDPQQTKNKITELSTKLKVKLKGFLVKNSQEELIGIVEDLKLSEKQGLQLVLSKPNNGANPEFFELGSQLISTVDTPNRSLYLRESFENGQTGKSDGLDSHARVAEEEMIRLFEEQLVVERGKQKVGEVIVRKEIETRMVEVPVRREKLIVEQVGSPEKPLAEIDLGQGQVTGVELAHAQKSEDGATVVRGEFLSPKAVSDLLEAIALQKDHGCAKVRVELVLNDAKYQENYQNLFDRCQSKKKS